MQESKHTRICSNKSAEKTLWVIPERAWRPLWHPYKGMGWGTMNRAQPELMPSRSTRLDTKQEQYHRKFLVLH